MASDDVESIRELFSQLSVRSKEEFLFQILTNENIKSDIINIVRKHKSLLQRFICNEDIFICNSCIKSTYVDNRCMCAGCHKDYCFTCMSVTYNNNKSKGWYYCLSEYCQKQYDEYK